MSGKYNIRVAVTGINSSANPGPGVAVIRAIRASEDFSGSIVGLAYDPLEPGIFMEGICDHAYLFPYPSEGASSMLARIEEIHKETPIDVIIPSLDSELAAFIRIAPQLKTMGIGMFLPDDKGLKIRSKANLARLAEQHQISVPNGKPVTDLLSVDRLAHEFQFPVVVKGQFYGAAIAYSPAQARALFLEQSSKWGLPVVIQQYVPGEEYDVVALGDGHGGLVGAVPMRKLQLTEQGKAWGGVTIANSELREFVEQIVRELQWRGPCEIEIMKAHEDGKLYLLEINPRFPAWCYLSVGAGQNLPWATVRLALGESVTPFEEYQVGTMFLRHSIDMVYPLSDYQAMTTAGALHHSPSKPK